MVARFRLNKESRVGALSSGRCHDGGHSYCAIGRFTDAYGQNSCTAGRAAFITGQSPFRTGLLKVGLPGAPEGLHKGDLAHGKDHGGVNRDVSSDDEMSRAVTAFFKRHLAKE